MILISGTIILDHDDEIEQITSALQRRAQRSRQDAGCIDYQFSVSLDNPRELRLFEAWESEELLQAHLAVPDPEFSEVLARGHIETALVQAHEVGATREMMRR